MLTIVVKMKYDGVDQMEERLKEIARISSNQQRIAIFYLSVFIVLPMVVLTSANYIFVALKTRAWLK